MKNISVILCIVVVVGSLLSGCAKQPPPLTYLASEKPVTIIAVQQQRSIKKSFSRGGWYFGNSNFRPAPDVGLYLRESEKEVKSNVLVNTDIKLSIPFALDILFFGYNNGTDVVTAGEQPDK